MGTESASEGAITRASNWPIAPRPQAVSWRASASDAMKDAKPRTSTPKSSDAAEDGDVRQMTVA
jgi:hypothetical protein